MTPRFCFFEKRFFSKDKVTSTFWTSLTSLKKKGQQVVSLNAAQYEQFKSYFDLVYHKSIENAPQTSAIIRSLIYIILHEIDNAHQNQLSFQSPEVDKGTHILAQFKALLSEYFKEERQVSFYADKMHLTPKYFSTVIKEVSGKTAGEWIREMLLLEAKVRLQNKEQSIAQIAYDLHFSDPSHFGKFFKKHIGISPLEYRS